MKIVCTHCQAGYQVDIPDIKPAGVEFKCAKCQQKFLVKPQSTDQVQENISNQATAAAGAALGKTPDSVVKEEEPSPAEQEPPPQEEETPQEDNLDNLLDNFLSEDLDPEPEEEQKTETTPAATATDGADDLGGLLDDLITTDAAAGATEALPEEGDSDMPDAAPAEESTETSPKLEETRVTDMPEDENEDVEDEEQSETADTGDDELDDFLDDLLNEDEDEEEEEETPEESAEEENEEEPAEEETADIVAEESEQTETAPPDEDTPPEEASEEDLWAQAFADQDAVEEGQAATETAEADEGEAAVEDEEDIEDDEEEGEDEEEDEYGEGDEDDELGMGEEYDDDYDDEEFEIPQKKKFGLPTTKTGKMIATGCVAALLLTGGGLYFGWKTFAPDELLQMGKSDTEIPDELTPKPEEGTDVEEPEAEEDAPPGETPEPEQEQASEKEEQPAPKKSQPTGVAGGEEDKESDLAKELAQSDVLKDSVEGGEDEGLLAALSPEETQVTLSTIMPVAFDATDIRVLSFDILIETSDRPSAQVIREALPIYEKVTMNTVEQFLRNKFYNDILYVKEKLQRRLQNNFNKKIEGSGRVKKVKFTEFMIQ